MPVSKRTRYEVLRRDEYTCRYCRSTENQLTVDHVTPVSLGGSDKPDNLVACCKDCNAGKSSSSPDGALVAEVSDTAIRWSEAMQKAASALDEQVDAKAEYMAAFFEAWPSYRYMPDSMISTVERFFALGLPESVMADAATTAGNQRGVYDRPAYFAGICWKRLRAMQELAAQFLAEEDACHASE